MDKTTKEKWVKALRSGEYEQGRSALRNDADQCCCLGVLCDLVKDQYENLVWYKATSASDIYCIGGSSGYVPSDISEDLDLNEPNQEALVDLNDNEDATFDEIANWIEKNL